MRPQRHSKIAEAETDPREIVPPPAPPAPKTDAGVQVATGPTPEAKPVENKHVVTMINGSTISERIFYLDPQSGRVLRSELRETPMPVKADSTKLDRLPLPDEKEKKDKAPNTADAT